MPCKCWNKLSRLEIIMQINVFLQIHNMTINVAKGHIPMKFPGCHKFESFPTRGVQQKLQKPFLVKYPW